MFRMRCIKFLNKSFYRISTCCFSQKCKFFKIIKNVTLLLSWIIIPTSIAFSCSFLFLSLMLLDKICRKSRYLRHTLLIFKAIPFTGLYCTNRLLFCIVPRIARLSDSEQRTTISYQTGMEQSVFWFFRAAAY